MSNMAAKHGRGAFQCSCCDRSGKVRRTGKRGVKQRERREWKKDQADG